MTRRLAADEKALWTKVAATVTPLKGRAAEPVAAPETPEAVPPPRKSAGPVRQRSAPAAPGPAPATPQPPPETLDGAWDRRIMRGRLVPDRVVDLHGLALEPARRALYAAVAGADARGDRVLLVITGKGGTPGPAPVDLMPGHESALRRGAIRVTLPRWLGEAGLSSRIAAVRRAHPRHGGAGAAYVILKRHKPAG